MANDTARGEILPITFFSVVVQLFHFEMTFLVLTASEHAEGSWFLSLRPGLPTLHDLAVHRRNAVDAVEEGSSKKKRPRHPAKKTPGKQ